MNFINNIFNNINFYLNDKIKLRFYIAFILTLFASIIELIGVASLPLLLSFFFENQTNSNINKIKEIINLPDTVIILPIIILIIFLFKNFFLAFVYFFEDKLSKDINISLKSNLFNGYLKLPFKHYLKNNSSTFVRNIIDDTDNVSWYFSVLFVFGREILTVTLITSYLIFIDYKTTLTLLLIFIILVGVYYTTLKNKVRDYSYKNLNYRKYQLKNLSQTFETIDLIKIFDKISHFKNIFDNITDSKEKYNFYINYLSRLPKLILELTAIFAIIFVIIKLSTSNIPNENFISYIALLIICIVRFIPAFTAITNSLVIMKKVKVSVDRIQNIYKTIIKNQSIITNEKVSKFVDTDHIAINVSNLSFKYEDTNKFIFEKKNFKFETNDNVALVGPSGSGKSTFIKILIGLLEPTFGEIKYNSNNIFLNLKDWQKLIGYIPQKIFLQDDTILKNIAFGVKDENIDKDRVEKVIKLAKLEKFINNLPQGLNSKVGNQGSNISGGQLQRIGIARALYGIPEILIMDEATNALDEKTEKEIIDSINSLDEIKIKIIISHRNSTVKSCNKIIQFDKNDTKK